MTTKKISLENCTRRFKIETFAEDTLPTYGSNFGSCDADVRVAELDFSIITTGG